LLTSDDSIEELGGIWEVRRLSRKQGTDFILPNLGGPAKEEVKLRSESECDSPEKNFCYHGGGIRRKEVATSTASSVF